MGKIIETKELAPIKSRITKMQVVVDSLVVKDEKTQIQATNILSSIKNVAKDIDSKKKEITKPMNDALKATRALFLPLENQYKKAEGIVKTKIIKYYQYQEIRRFDVEKALTERVEKGTLRVETAAEKLEKIPEAKTHVVGDRGAVTIKKIKKFKVVDMSKLPLRFHLANEPVIREQMNAGESNLPGVEYWEEEIVSAH